ncbi:MAG: hypothetical protein IPF53_20450 [Blastocatellia bacterium]|nr:hypothetical protein [Blastocatellia bacterium]MBK6427139.1 hypothetical protein [Blastocatellia bacterium]
MNRIFIAAALMAFALGAGAAPIVLAGIAQDPATQGTINVPPEELKAYGPIKAAKTVDETFKAAAAFTAKYPKSAAVAQIPYDLAAAIEKTPKDEARLAINERFKQTFPGHELGLELDRRMADYYLDKGDLASLMKVCDAYLAKHPDDTRTHYLMLRVSVDALKKNDSSHLPSGKEHGAKAIALLESPTRTADFVTDAEWTAFKAENLALAYQSYGLIALVTGDAPGASSYITKASEVAPTDPFNFFLLANIRYSDYEVAAKAFNDKIDKTTDDAKKKLEVANAAQDQVIAVLLKSVALSEGKQEYAGVYAQANGMLEDMWKGRHGGKLDGLADAVKAAKGGK